MAKARKGLYDWLKLGVDSKWIFIILLGFSGSALTNVKQYFSGVDKDTQRVKEVREVATAFQSVMVESEVKDKKVIIYKPNCNICKKLVDGHNNEHHK